MKKHWDSLKAKSNLAQIQSSAPSTTSDVVVEVDSKSKKRGSAASSSGSRKKKKVSQEIDNQSNNNAAVAVNRTTTETGKESSFIPNLIKLYLKYIDQVSAEANESVVIAFIETFLEFLIDLLSQLPTRRFLRTLLDDLNIITSTKLSYYYKSSVSAEKNESASSSSLIVHLTEILDKYMNFPFHDQTGKAALPQEITTRYYSRVHQLQQIAYNHYFEELKDLVFSSIGRLLKEETLRKHFLPLSLSQVIDIVIKLGRLSHTDIKLLKDKYMPSTAVIGESLTDNELEEDMDCEELYEYIIQVLLDYLLPRPSPLEEINNLPLYPTEKIFWNANLIPASQVASVDKVFALPKLNLQFLTMFDYLLRNFILYRVESVYQIRQDIVDAIKRMGHYEGMKGNIVFKGWARMGIPINSVAINDIGKPTLGAIAPAFVNASTTVIPITVYNCLFILNAFQSQYF